MLSIAFYSRFDEEQLPSFTQRLTPWQTWLTQGMWATDSRMLCSSPIGPVWCTQSIVWQWMVVQLWPGGILKLCFVFFSEKHAAFKWKDTISGFPVSPGSAEAHSVEWRRYQVVWRTCPWADITRGQGNDSQEFEVGDANANCPLRFKKCRSEFTKTRHFKRKIHYLGGSLAPSVDLCLPRWTPLLAPN